MPINLRMKVFGFHQLAVGYNGVCVGNNEGSQNLLAAFQLHAGHFLRAAMSFYENSVYASADTDFTATSSKFLDERPGQSLGAALGVPAPIKVMRCNGSMDRCECPSWPNPVIAGLNR